MEIQSKLEGNHPIVAPTRELIKEGRLQKVSSKGGLSDRYVYVVSDLTSI